MPQNLGLAFDDPNNYFGQYVYETVKYYAGQIDQWIMWNEPEFKPTDAGAGGSFTWLGSDEEFAQLMKVGYLAAKKGNPNAVVSFPGHLVLGRHQQQPPPVLRPHPEHPGPGPERRGQQLLPRRRVAEPVPRPRRRLPRARRLQGRPEQVRHRQARLADRDQRHALGRHRHPVRRRRTPARPIKTTMDQQAAYAIQSLALAAAAGYSKIEFYQMVDANPCAEPAVWGLTRDDGTRRPVSDALKVAIGNFSGFTRAQFVPLTRETAALVGLAGAIRARWCPTGRCTRSPSTSRATSA